VLREIPLSIVRGFLMGAADIVPGVSGGTVALVLGIYERLVASIRAGSSALGALIRLDFAGFKSWMGRIEWALILPLGGGILVAVFSLASILERLLANHSEVMAALFLGLVLGSAVIAWKLLTVRDAFRLAVMFGVGVVVFLLLGLTESTTADGAAQISDPAIWSFFVAGAVAICAMILPGISGSFILVTIGMYGAVLAAVNNRDAASLTVFVLGTIVGLALFSQILHRALRDHYNAVMAALIGLMLGSLRVLWPWPLGVESTAIEAPGEHIPAALIAAVGAFLLVLGVEAAARRVVHRTTADEVEELTAD
jgi:putative membrane protein